MLFKGSGVALVTPFNKRGEVDFFTLKNLIDFQIANGTQALIILGTTGESSTITYEEREKIITFVVCKANHRIPVIVGCGSNSTSTAIELIKQAEDLGADGALIVTPYYNKANQNGLFEHYKAIASSTHLKIIIYNVPSRTGVNILPETVIKLSKIKNIVGIKEASGNLSQIAEICKKVSKSFAVYSGDDLLTLPMLSLGASGVISVTANCYPADVELLCLFSQKHDFFNAKRIHNKLFDINKALFLDINPICVKYYLSLMGFSVGKPRLPLTEPDNETKSKLKEVKNQYEN